MMLGKYFKKLTSLFILVIFLFTTVMTLPGVSAYSLYEKSNIEPETALSSESENVDLSNWMECLEDTCTITDLTLPGSHDSGTYNIKYTQSVDELVNEIITLVKGKISSIVWTFAGSTITKTLRQLCTREFVSVVQQLGGKCQDQNIEQQLECGVRYFDLRCRYEDGEYIIHHGDHEDQATLRKLIATCRCMNDKGNPLTIQEVFGTFSSFLNEHNGEIITFRLWPNNTMTDEQKKTLQSIVDVYSCQYRDIKTKKLSEIRSGKRIIDITDQYEEKSQGATVNDRIVSFKNVLDDLGKYGNGGNLYLTESNIAVKIVELYDDTKECCLDIDTSDISIFGDGLHGILLKGRGVLSPYQQSVWMKDANNDYISKSTTGILEYIKSKQQGQYGIIACDFVNEELSRAIIGLNNKLKTTKFLEDSNNELMTNNVQSDSNTASVSLGTTALQAHTVGTATTDESGSYVYFGKNRSTPLTFSVLDTNSGASTGDFSFNKSSRGILMDCVNVLYSQNNGSKYVYNKNSSLTDKLGNYMHTNNWGAKSSDNSYNELFSEFNSKLSFITLDAGVLSNAVLQSSKDSDFSMLCDTEMDDEKIFPLSIQELKDYYGSTFNSGTNARKYALTNSNYSAPYWLRSAFVLTNYAGAVTDYGYPTIMDVADEYGVSPACNLDASSIIFTSTGKNISKFNNITTSGSTSKDNPLTLGLKATNQTPSFSGLQKETSSTSFKVNNATGFANIAAVLCNSDGSIEKFGKIEPNESGNYSIGTTSTSQKIYIFAYDDSTNDATIHCTSLVEVKESGGGGEVTTQYSISASATAGGSITPSGTVKVEEGKSQSFTATPDEGYTLDKFVVDGEDEYINGNTYTFDSVNANHTIQAVFAKKDEPQPEPEPTPEPTKNGWVNANGKWQYYKDGNFLTDWQNNIPGWEGQWFYFDNATGYAKSAWADDIHGWVGQWFYFNPNTCVMMKNWVNDGGVRFFYLDDNTGVMKKGWHYLNWSGGANWFYFDNNGSCLTNTTTPDGYYVDQNGVWR